MGYRGLYYIKIEKFQDDYWLMVMINQRRKNYDTNKRKIKKRCEL